MFLMIKQVITAELKINHSKEQKAQLDAVCLAYRDALNFASKVAFENNKTSNKIKIQELTYYDIREQFQLGAQTTCSIARDVGAKYKAQWTLLKKHIQNVKLGYTKKRYKGLDKPVVYKSRTATLQYKKDFSFSFEKNLVSIATLDKRIKAEFSGWDSHLELLKTSKIGAANLIYDKNKQQYYLCVVIEIEVNDVNLSKIKKVKGVDLGQRYLAVTQSNENEVKFYSGKEVKHKSNQYSRKRKELQAKGTKSAKRRLSKLSGKERRFKQNVNHFLSKQILKEQCIIGLEDLTDIRERTKRRKGKKASKKQRRANASASKWTFAELGNFLTYKANLQGSLVVKVDANYTSQMCIKCGHTAKENRPNKGLDFICVCCGYSTHADRLGAMNILMRTLLVRQVLISTGSLSSCLDVKSDEAKAERLKAFSELRWSDLQANVL